MARSNDRHIFARRTLFFCESHLRHRIAKEDCMRGSLTQLFYDNDIFVSDLTLLRSTSLCSCKFLGHGVISLSHSPGANYHGENADYFPKIKSVVR